MRRRRELRAEEARIQSERETLTRTRTRAESYALIAAAVVGAVSLAVSAWGTYWTAQVAEDQLAQSKEQDAEKKKDQASKVIFWVEGGSGIFPGIGTRLVITNQSQYPLTLLTVGFRITEQRDERTEWSSVARVATGGVPPCSELRVEADDLLHTNGKPVGDGPAALGVLSLGFVDSKGEAWWRDESGRLEADGDFVQGQSTETTFEVNGKARKRKGLDPSQPAITFGEFKPMGGCGSDT
ncbi:hypothetical protein GCM10010306_090860 [Streptomyces umbrinus]|uniref:hypothetical protein n=1 Tax=Streptomyces umbrinus TaxID=67370 RepID=UPI001679F9C6|nr:hypothetical protein [Streptomyces umbrinus]GHB82140.1 hypothetical protein GCM10010306_090860 [Streptomyces umbrinus]